MRLSELLEILRDIDKNTTDDPEVLVAIQPNYPLQCSVINVREVGYTVYVAAGEANEYGPRQAWEQV